MEGYHWLSGCINLLEANTSINSSHTIMGLFSKPCEQTTDGPKSGFKTQYSLGKHFHLSRTIIYFFVEERKAQYKKVIESHPTKIPVIVERASHSTLSDIDKSKYLVPPDLTIAQFIYLIRKRIKLANDQALFIYINGQLPASSALFSTIYKDHKSEDDGFLYVVYTGETCFGNL